MLEQTPIWTTGSMHLWLDNKPAKVYIPKSNVKSTYNNLQSRLSKEGSIPIGIDHLPDNIIEANPILKKLDLLHVGDITKITYSDDTIQIVEAELTNPLLKDLYNKGELDMVSIVANSTTSECPQDYDYIVNSTDITRVDIVEKGACPTCNIPKPTDSSDTVVYARYSIQNKEEIIMAEEITMEAIEKLFDKKFEEKLEPINERLNKLEENSPEAGNKKKEENNEGGDKEVEARLAKLEAEQKEQLALQAASAKVDLAIQAGKIKPADKENMIAFAKDSSESFDEYIKNAEVIVPLGARKSMKGGDSETNSNGNDVDKQIEDLNAKFGKGE